MRVLLYVSAYNIGNELIKQINVSDDTTEDELNDMAKQLMLENIKYGFITEHQLEGVGDAENENKDE